MQHVRKQVANTSRPGRPQDRSKVTNTGLLAGMDGRSPEARRYKDLVIGFVGQYRIGTDAGVALAETAAAIKMQIESITTAMCNDERVDKSELGRLSSELRHILSDLQRGAIADAPTPAFASVPCEAEDEGDD